MDIAADPGSFRDPSGFVFRRGDTLYRQVQQSYRAEYDRFVSSGLYEALAREGMLVAHTEADLSAALTDGAYRVLCPDEIPLISYPYEWCFSQLRDAALVTLGIQKTAVEYGMSLKDASAYNVQFVGSRAVFIDTLSFELLDDQAPWTAYRQFCQHFLAPLALMSRVDVRLGALLRVYVDGIPLDLASRLLPRRSRLDPGLLMHVHMHASAQRRHSSAQSVRPATARGMGRTALLGLIDSLEGAVRKLRWEPSGTVWADYYDHTNYSDGAMAGKRALVDQMLAAMTPEPATVWDLGANTGAFSSLAAARGAYTAAWDIDPAAVERNYLACKARGNDRVLPLLLDLTNPSPALGWALRERTSLTGRGPASAVLALALVHHLAIGNNVPMNDVASFLRSLAPYLVIEFVPKDDSQVQHLLASRRDVFPGYTRAGFEAAFGAHYDVVEVSDVPDSRRVMYLMKGKSGGR